ncbi:unnamed protein product [Prunus armeniaca]|uniref:Uncharacterized protein n=1 Tax=Prunus armeniaca TaxID=36596 RepID=A0A6J5VBG8_PRUAR|nr:unnamed protein product [Prunus armeniaca]CAB4316728.1 unnamed protein product [Prunus armeniaca]
MPKAPEKFIQIACGHAAENIVSSTKPENRADWGVNSKTTSFFVENVFFLLDSTLSSLSQLATSVSDKPPLPQPTRYTGLDVICLNEELGYVLVYGKGDFIMGIPSLRIYRVHLHAFCKIWDIQIIL